MYADRLRDGESKLAARRKVGELLGINPATLRNWIEAAEKAERPVGPSGLSLTDENARLKKENAELRRANEILKTASAFFAQAELCATRRDVDREVVRDHLRWAVAAA